MTRTVLLVEDDYDVRETVREVLADEGYQVVVAADGQEALDRLRGGCAPFVIVLDMMMAGMNGLQFRAAQRADPALAGIPVVVLTANRDIERRAEELQAAVYLRKPAQLEELLEVLRRFHD